MIAVCPNPYRDSGLSLTRTAVEVLQAEGFQTVICPIFSVSGDGVLPENLVYAKLEDVAPECSLVVVIGGDGTILAAARAVKEFDLPILGVNLGTMGFLASVEPKDIRMVADAAKGNYGISKRMMLDVELYRDGELVMKDSALNDVVLHGCGDCIRVKAACDAGNITAFSGDGIIVSTPTGATGYSLSAGGPIVEPQAENLIITPICPHILGFRSFVLGGEREITVTAARTHQRMPYISVDGAESVDYHSGDVLKVRKSSLCTKMVDLGLKSFYETAYEKLT